MARNVLPNRAVRFIVSPLRTPMIGVWVPSRDAYGETFPLVFVRRLHAESHGADANQQGFARRVRTREPRHVGELSWTLQLAACSHYLAAVEGHLMLGQADSAIEVWRALEALPMPAQSDLVELCQGAQRALERELVGEFAARTLRAPPHAPAFAAAIRRLRAPVASVSAMRAGERTNAEASPEFATLALPAHDEFDLFTWLELLRAQRVRAATPRAVFWCPADRRALASFGVPAPTLITFLRQPRNDEVQMLPLANDPDECPAWDAELQSSIGGCSTLMQLRAAVRCATLEPAPACHLQPQPAPQRPRSETPRSPVAADAHRDAEPIAATRNLHRDPQPHRTPEPTTVPCNAPRAAFLHSSEPVTVPCSPRFDARLYDLQHADSIAPPSPAQRTTEPVSPLDLPLTPNVPPLHVPFNISDLPSANSRLRRKLLAPAADPLPPEAAAFQPPPLSSRREHLHASR